MGCVCGMLDLKMYFHIKPTDKWNGIKIPLTIISWIPNNAFIKYYDCRCLLRVLFMLNQ